MLTLAIAGSCKQSQKCHCKIKNAQSLTNLWINEYKSQFLPPRRRLTSKTYNRNSSSSSNNGKGKLTTSPSNKNLKKSELWMSKEQIHSSVLVNSTKDQKPIDLLDQKDYQDVLSVALDQSNASIAQSLIDNTFNLLRKGSPGLAWECYTDLTSRNIQRYISRDQYKQLIKHFNHLKPNHEQGLEYILTLVEDMHKLGYQVGRKEKLLVMRLLGVNGNLRAMEKIFQDLSQEQLLYVTDLAAAQKPFNIMLSCYGDHSEKVGAKTVAEKSMEIYGDMLDRNIHPTASTTNLLMSNIDMAKSSDEMVEKVWEWVWTKIGMNVGGKTSELDPTLYRDMVMYFSRVGRPEYALEINDIMTKKKIPRTARMLTALIHKVGRSGKIDHAMNLLNEMLIVEGLTPTVVTFNALIDIHAHKKPEPDFAGANRMYNMLNEVGLQPDEVTFGTLIDMFAKKGDLEGVRKLYNDMIKNHKIAPNPYVYSSFIECFINLGDRKSAMDTLKLLKKESGHRTTSVRKAYNLMFKGLVESDHITESLELLNVMSKEHMRMEPRTFGPLLSYFAKRGETIGCHKVASMMTQANVKPNSHTYAILLEAFAKASDSEGAENIFNIYKQKYRPNVYVYNALLYVYTKRNEMDKVLDTYKRMSKAFVPANEHTYGILMYFYSKRREVKSVESLLDTMQSIHITPGPICWTILMQTYFESQRPDDGKVIMERMIQAGLEPTSVSWGILINGTVNAGELDFAESMLQENIDRSKRLESEEFQRRLLINPNFKKTTYVNELPETIEDIMDRASNELKKKYTLSPYLFTPIINAHSKAGNFDRAKELVQTMCDLSVPITIPTYVALMGVFYNEKRYDGVEILWKSIYDKNYCKKIEGLDTLIPTIPVPERRYNYIDLLTFGDETDEEVGEVLKPVQEQTPLFALSIYIDSLIDQNRAEEVEKLWGKLTDEGYQFDEHNWNRYIVALIALGKIEKACLVASEKFFEHEFGDDEEDHGNVVTRTVRKRDDIFISNDNQLHTRTCVILADVLQVTGANSMGEPRLRSAVTESVKKFLQQQQAKE